MLATAVGPNLTKLLHDQLELMFACGLSEPLHSALVNIARYIPPLLKTIQSRLLDLLSTILSGQAYKPLGAPPLLRGEAPVLTRDISTEVRGAPCCGLSSTDLDVYRPVLERRALNCSFWLSTRWGRSTLVVRAEICR